MVQNSLQDEQKSLTPQGNNNLNFRFAHDQGSINIQDLNIPNDFFPFFILFLSWEVKQNTNSGAARNSDVPVGFVSGNIEGLGEQNSLFPMGPVIKCLLTHIEQHVKFITSYKDSLLACQVASVISERKHSSLIISSIYSNI